MSWFLLPMIVIILYLIGSNLWSNLREAIPALGDLRSIQERIR